MSSNNSDDNDNDNDNDNDIADTANSSTTADQSNTAS